MELVRHKEIFCNDCQQIFSVTKDNLRKRNDRYFVECPFCGEVTYLRHSPELNEMWNIKQEEITEKWKKRGVELKVKPRKRTRTCSKLLEEYLKDYSPIKDDLGIEKPEEKTTIEHIKNLQEILVQTCIDYINYNGLTDIWAVRFSADSLDESSQYGEWTPATDSSITVEGIAEHKYKRENGEDFSMAERYEIGSYY